MQPTSRPASSSTRTAISPNPRPHTNQVNTQTKVLDTLHGRILCIADVRGRLSALNDLAREANAKAIIHTGDFGFFESISLERINDRTLRHLTMYSPLITTAQRNHLLAPENTPSTIRSTVDISLISEFPLLLSGQIKLQIPVYTVWGACEDVILLEKFRTGTYAIDNLHVLDEATTRCLDVGGVKLRLLGLGGALVPHKMFDNGDGNATIAGGQGTMWTTALQIGELVDTAQRVFDPTETRLLVTHASPGREGIIAQLGLVLKVDLTISAGLHFRYASSYNEFSVQGDFEGFRHKLLVGKEGFDKVWDSVKTQVDTVIDEHQRILLDKALSVIERIPPAQGQAGAPPTATGEEPAWKNCWNWNLCDAAFGSLVLDIKEGRISAELKSQGFNYAYRRTATPGTVAHTPNSTTSSLPNAVANLPTKSSTPAPAEKPASPMPKEAKSPLVATSPVVSAKDTPKEGTSNLPKTKTNGTPAGPPSDKAEKDKQKKRDKKDKKDKERVERETKERDSAEDKADASSSVIDPAAPQPKSGKGTPVPDEVAKTSTPDVLDAGLKSPTTDSAGMRTPTSRRGHKQAWTLFVRLQASASDTELRDFFGGEQSGIVRVNCPHNQSGRTQKIAYVEFGDEDTMKAGLEKHNEKINDFPVDVRIAIDKDDRGGARGRGRGGRGGAFAARGFAAAGLTQGKGRGTNTEARGSGENDKTGDSVV